MSGVLKWMENKLERINAIAEGLNDDEKPAFDATAAQEVQLLQEQVFKLRSDLRTVRNLSEQQVNELHDKYKAQVEGLVAFSEGLKAQVGKLAAENSFLVQQREVIEQQLVRAQQLNAQLLETIEREPEPQQQTEDSHEYLAGELVVTKQYLANVKALLAAEKLKNEDMDRDKFLAEQQHLSEIEKLTSQIDEANASREAVYQELLELKAQFDEAKKVEKGFTTQQNMQALADHLQTKQRTIESLLSERATLMLQLEKEKNENLKLIQSSGATLSLARQPISSLSVFRGRKLLRRVADWVDGGLSELSDTVREQAVARLGLLVYLVVIHLWVLYSFTSDSQPPFLGNG